MVYLDLNPVRAGLVAEAAQYRWSSYAHYVGASHDRLVAPHPLFWGLGNTPFSREAAYAELVRSGVTAADQQALTASALQGWALGPAEYLADLQKRTSRRLSKGRPGRPPTAPRSN
jgi:putative transposase